MLTNKEIKECAEKLKNMLEKYQIYTGIIKDLDRLVIDHSEPEQTYPVGSVFVDEKQYEFKIVHVGLSDSICYVTRSTVYSYDVSKVKVKDFDAITETELIKLFGTDLWNRLTLKEPEPEKEILYGGSKNSGKAYVSGIFTGTVEVKPDTANLCKHGYIFGVDYKECYCIDKTSSPCNLPDYPEKHPNGNKLWEECCARS